MKASTYIADFLSELVDHAFVLTGGCIIHVIDSIGEHDNIKYIPVAHEQAGAMAADAYSRISGFGVAIATSGPGATNLLTGVCCSYYDSVPVLLITGQVPSNQLKGESKSRQVGFQETDVVSIFTPVTKYAKQITDASQLRFELEKAVYLAQEGRKGPVLLDICDDVQRAEIDPETMIRFKPPIKDVSTGKPDYFDVMEALNKAKRPIVIIGAGAKCEATKRFIEYSGLPFTLTWGAKDFVSHDHPQFVGGFGVTEGRAGNFAVQNSDLILAVGTRLDTHETGDYETFAPKAYKIMVDIDQSELDKHPVDHPIKSTAKDFFNYIPITKPYDCREWLKIIGKWKKKYPIVLPEYRAEIPRNPYVWMEQLSNACDSNAIIVTDCGSNLVWTMAGFKVKGQTLISAFNHSPMGYSLPAAMGAKLAAPDREVICIIGDGGYLVNVQEMETINRLNLDIVIYVLDNQGYGIIKGTQDTWLEGRHHAADYDNGLPTVNLGVEEYYQIKWVWLQSGPQIAPKLLPGRPLHDASPLLSREELKENML